MGKFFRTNLISFLLIFAFMGSYYPVSGGGYSNLSLHSGDFSPDQVLVKFDGEVSIKSRNRFIRQADARVISEISPIGALILEVPRGEVDAAIAELRQQTGVIYAEPNYYVEVTDIIPNDPGWGNQYNLTAIRAPAGWALNTGAVWVTIAILDTGVDFSHPDLFVRILPGYDFVNNDADPQDDNGHGTHVAAIAAASTDNGEGVAGVNWGANILPVKVLNASGNGTYANVAAGIVWATDHGAQVINLSLGGPTPSFVLNDAVNYAYQRGVILVASTGNAGIPAVLYPAAYDPVIAVGATDSTNSWAGFSNYGPEVDVVAPGVNIYSAFLGGGYGYRSGTSMAAPHVSGFAALLWGIPGNGPARIRTLIESNTLDLGSPGWDEYFGYGLIQMDTAIQQALPTATPTQSERLEATPENPIPFPNSEPVYIVPIVTDFSPTQTSSIEITETSTFLFPANETSDVNALGNISPTPTLINNTESTQMTGENSWIGCWGIILILMGIFLFWLVSRNRKTLQFRRFK